MTRTRDALQDFRRTQTSAVLVPLALLLVLALGLGVAIRVLLSASSQATRSDRVIGLTERYRKLLIDEETGLRGYQLTSDRAFLQPLERARRDLPTLRNELSAALATDPPQHARYAAMLRLTEAWEEFARRQLNDSDRPTGVTSLSAQLDGKARMDAIRAAADELIAAESVRKQTRSARAIAIGTGVFFGSVGWAVMVGAVLALFTKRHLQILTSLHEVALAEARRQAADAVRAAREVQSLNAQLESRVVERTAALEAANGELEAFSYSVSHDLRAPLRHVAGFVQMLARTAAPKLDEKEHHYLETIASAAQRAGRLIDDLLSFSRMTRAELQWARVDTEHLATEVLEDLSRGAPGRDVRWRLGSLPDVRGDPAMLRQVFENLMANALKYTRDRSPAEIEVGSVRQEDGQTVFFVRDNGVGFDMRYAEKLFGVFQRLHRSDEFEGTGIGLAHVRRIVLRHGGRVWAEAELGRGATFFFSLPPPVATAGDEVERGAPPAHQVPEVRA